MRASSNNNSKPAIEEPAKDETTSLVKHNTVIDKAKDIIGEANEKIAALNAECDEYNASNDGLEKELLRLREEEKESDALSAQYKEQLNEQNATLAEWKEKIHKLSQEIIQIQAKRRKAEQEYKLNLLSISDTMHKVHGDNVYKLKYNKMSQKTLVFTEKINHLFYYDDSGPKFFVVCDISIDNNLIAKHFDDNKWFLLFGKKRSALFVAQTMELRNKWVRFIKKSLSSNEEMSNTEHIRWNTNPIALIPAAEDSDTEQRTEEELDDIFKEHIVTENEDDILYEENEQNLSDKEEKEEHEELKQSEIIQVIPNEIEINDDEKEEEKLEFEETLKCEVNEHDKFNANHTNSANQTHSAQSSISIQLPPKSTVITSSHSVQNSFSHSLRPKNKQKSRGRAKSNSLQKKSLKSLNHDRARTLSVNTLSTSLALPIHVTVTYRLQKEKIDVFLKAIKPMIRATNKEKGCIRFNIHQDKGDETKLIMLEEWQNQKYLTAHLKQPHLIKFREYIRKQDVYQAPPKVFFCKELVL